MCFFNFDDPDENLIAGALVKEKKIYIKLVYHDSFFKGYLYKFTMRTNHWR